MAPPSSNELGKYWGNNIEVNGRNAERFQLLVEKVERKVCEWQNLALSHACRILLINVILVSLCHHVFFSLSDSKENRGYH